MTDQKFTNCPKCGAEVTCVKLADVTFESCPNCHGMFLEANEVQALSKESESSSQEVTTKRRDSTELDDLVIKCPACLVDMDKKRPKGNRGPLLDICPSCKGIWFDHQEYEKLHNNFFGSFFKPKRFKVKLTCRACKVTTDFHPSKNIPSCPRCQKHMSFEGVGTKFEPDYKVGAGLMSMLLIGLGGIFFITKHMSGSWLEATILTAILGACSLFFLSFYIWRNENDDFYAGDYLFPFRR